MLREARWTGPSRTSRCPIRRVPTRTFEMAGPAEIKIHLDRPAYVYPMFEQALRIAAGETSDEHRRRIGELWAQFSAVAADNPHAWSRNPVSAEEIWQAGPGQPDDQLAVHQADELQQHGRPGRRADPDVGGEGDASADPHRPVGVPVRGYRRARHLPDRRARRVQPLARHPDRRQRGRSNWRASASTTSTWSTSTRASRRRSRSPRTNSDCRSATPSAR